VVTGGGALTDGLLPGLQDALRHTVELANPLSTMAIGKTGLSSEELNQAVPYLVTPIGLALWATTPGRPMSLLPDEVLRERRQRHQTTAVAFAVTSVAALLGLAWTGRAAQVNSAQRHATQSEAKSAELAAQVAKLDDVTHVQADVAAQKLRYSASLAGDVDWVRLLEQVTAVMPADIHMTTFSGVRAVVPGGALTSDGTITLAAIAQKGPESVANWIRALETIPGLSGTWTTSITKTDTAVGAGNAVSFTTSASVTRAAESQRSVQAGAKP
jgi:Tfp pilus assembly protein PilN